MNGRKTLEVERYLASKGVLTTDHKPKRRTNWQALAHRKYPRMTYVGGDGDWLVCIQCTDRWQYRLFEWRDDAERWMAEIDAKRCGTACMGKSKHRIWRMAE